MSYKLTLRSKNSPFSGQFTDINLGSVLSHNELDNNFINIKGNLVYTADTSGTTLTFYKVNNETFDVDLSSLIDAGDTFTTASTLFNQTLYFDTNDTLSAYTVDLSALGDTGSTIVPLIYNQSITEPNNSIQPAFGTSTVGSGATWSNILGGENNQINNVNGSVIVGGRNHIITDSNKQSFIGGGYLNLIGGTSTWGGNSIQGGSSNTLSASSYSSIIGGYKNYSVLSRYSMIGSGNNNALASRNSFIGSGGYNYLQSIGEAKTAGYHVIGGGYANRMVLGVSTSLYNFIGGGNGNEMNGAMSSSSIVGGEGNTMSGTGITHSSIGGGQSNTINDGSTNSSIVGGYNNYVSSPHISNSYRGASNIGGGRDNRIGSYTPTNTGLTSTYLPNWSNIGGGRNNKIEGVNYWNPNTIGGGMNNTISPIETNPNSPYLPGVGGNTIGGGLYNSTHGYRGTIGGGSNNVLNPTWGPTIGGGIDNTIGRNDLTSAYLSLCATIIGGNGNAIGDPNYNNNVLLGVPFGASNAFSSIAGGRRNIIYLSRSSSIGGGELNKIIGISGEAEAVNYNVIGGGLTNLINSGTSKTFIGGGENNELFESDSSSIVGGQNNYITGDNNFIGGGTNNINSGTTSSILGGQDNVVSFGFGDTHIVGSNITSVSADTTHVNNLNIFDIPESGETITDVLVRDTNGMVRTRNVSSFTGGTSATTAVIATKYAETRGFTADTTETINHGFGLGGGEEYDIVLKLRDITNNLEINGVIDNFTSNTVDVTFSQTHPSIRIVIIA